MTFHSINSTSSEKKVERSLRETMDRVGDTIANVPDVHLEQMEL